MRVQLKYECIKNYIKTFELVLGGVSNILVKKKYYAHTNYKMQMCNVSVSTYELNGLIIPLKTVTIQYKDE